jgi:hypothetical protein
MKRSNNNNNISMHGKILNSKPDIFNQIILKKILPNLINLKYDKYDDINLFINNGEFYNIINLIKKFISLPQAKLALESVLLIKKSFNQNDEINYYKNIRYLEILKNIEKQKSKNINVDIVVDTIISSKYVIYISKYGFPDNGIFDEELLEIIEKTFIEHMLN